MIKLKKIIKPIVKECVERPFLIVAYYLTLCQVAQGMGNQFLVENKEQIVPTMSNENNVRMEAMSAEEGTNFQKPSCKVTRRYW